MFLEVIENLDQFTENDLIRELNILPPQRLRKALQFLHFRDRLCSALAFNLLASVLKKHFNIPLLPPFDFLPSGKPFFKDYPHIHFNISHCSSAVAVAVDNSPVGVDVETVKPLDRELLEFVCSSKEIDLILSSKQPETEFTSVWTKKEALLKFHGTAIPNPNKLKIILEEHLPDVPPFLTTFIRPNYTLSIASTSDTPIQYPLLHVKKP